MQNQWQPASPSSPGIGRNQSQMPQLPTSPYTSSYGQQQPDYAALQSQLQQVRDTTTVRKLFGSRATSIPAIGTSQPHAAVNGSATTAFPEVWGRESEWDTSPSPTGDAGPSPYDDDAAATKPPTAHLRCPATAAAATVLSWSNARPHLHSGSGCLLPGRGQFSLQHGQPSRSPPRVYPCQPHEGPSADGGSAQWGMDNRPL
jgi:hypothetical protein